MCQHLIDEMGKSEKWEALGTYIMNKMIYLNSVGSTRKASTDVTKTTSISKYYGNLGKCRKRNIIYIESIASCVEQARPDISGRTAEL
jgi:hypothetical protein